MRNMTATAHLVTLKERSLLRSPIAIWFQLYVDEGV